MNPRYVPELSCFCRRLMSMLPAEQLATLDISADVDIEVGDPFSGVLRIDPGDRVIRALPSEYHDSWAWYVDYGMCTGRIGLRRKISGWKIVVGDLYNTREIQDYWSKEHASEVRPRA